MFNRNQQPIRLYCYGDSNTFGYDPRNWGGRFDAPWPSLLTGFEVHNNGMNGRFVPRRREVFPRDFDLYLVMLGTNDILDGSTAQETAQRMERFLVTLPMKNILLLAPPPLKPGAWVDSPRLLEESAKLGEAYRETAERLGIAFLDTATWMVELGFDGVHFTEAGHRTFAEHLRTYLTAPV